MFIDCKSEKEWLGRRISYLTASDAGNYTGLNPYDSNGKLHLWEEKVGIRKRPDIGDKPAVRFGKNAEEHVRSLFMLKHPEYELQYDQYGLYVSDDHPFMAATLDGLLLNKTTGTHEILEVKTGTVRTGEALKDWTTRRLPINYWCQILHQSECVKWAVGIWVAALISLEWEPEQSFFLTFHYDTDDADFQADRRHIVSQASDMWQFITTRRRPPVAVAL